LAFFLQAAGCKRKLELPAAEAGNWVEFRRRALAIKPRQAQAEQSWVDIDGVQGGQNEKPSCWREVISSGAPDLHTGQLRNPQTFSVGGVHRSAQVSEELLQGYPQGERIGE